MRSGARFAAGEVALPATDAGGAVPASEPILVGLSQRGDPFAFARLVSLHEAMVVGLAARLLGDEEEARDVAQEVFLQVYRRLGRFEGRSSLKTWIYRIVVNQCRNRRRVWRRRGRERAVPLEELSAAEEARLAADGGAGPFEQARARERARCVQRALAELSFDHRVILLLREYEGLGCDQIAAALGLACGTVKSRLARAREALRERLLPLLPELRRP